MNSSPSASRLSVPVCIMGTRLDSSRQVERFARRSGAPFSTLGQEEGDKPRREKAKVTYAVPRAGRPPNLSAAGFCTCG